MSRLYLDHNATSPCKPEVRAAIVEALAEPTNASSIHAEGQWARRALNQAREQVAALVGAKAEQVYFTSGATEANNWVLRCGKRLIVSAIEHSSVRDAAPDATIIPVMKDGLVDLAALDDMLAAEPDLALVSLMLVNNETGIIQHVRAAAEIVHRHGGRFHVDAVQAVGRIAVDIEALGVDYLTLSAHKIAGPQGVGALVMAGLADIAPWQHGGTQENRRRAGTENVAGAIGFGVAAQLAQNPQSENTRLAALRDSLEAQLLNMSSSAKAEDPSRRHSHGPSADAEGDDSKLIIIGKHGQRVGNTSLIAVLGWPAETQIIGLDMDGIAVSAGAACSSGKVEPSHVLTAMGYDESISRCAIRISLGWTTTEADIARFVASWQKLYARYAGRVARAV